MLPAVCGDAGCRTITKGLGSLDTSAIAAIGRPFIIRYVTEDDVKATLNIATTIDLLEEVRWSSLATDSRSVTPRRRSRTRPA